MFYKGVWNGRVKYSFLENMFFFVVSMLGASREEPSSQDKLGLQKWFSLGSDSRKAVNRRVPDISAYCSISNSTACSTLLNIYIFIAHVE